MTWLQNILNERFMEHLEARCQYLMIHGLLPHCTLSSDPAFSLRLSVDAGGVEVRFEIFGMGAISSADEHEIDGHADADCGQEKAEGDGFAGDSAGAPGAGA
jgi:hypothetical protein